MSRRQLILRTHRRATMNIEEYPSFRTLVKHPAYKGLSGNLSAVAGCDLASQSRSRGCPSRPLSSTIFTSLSVTMNVGGHGAHPHAVFVSSALYLHCSIDILSSIRSRLLIASACHALTSSSTSSAHRSCVLFLTFVQTRLVPKAELTPEGFHTRAKRITGGLWACHMN
mmetsp:Transcript_161519/g.513324  ORF Transcript_161519/g.513324 Transcript_161519/m.513324 type:complete len:169 (+) Transcript_161519:818-1324(+)